MAWIEVSFMLKVSNYSNIWQEFSESPESIATQCTTYLEKNALVTLILVYWQTNIPIILSTLDWHKPRTNANPLGRKNANLKTQTQSFSRKRRQNFCTFVLKYNYCSKVKFFDCNSSFEATALKRVA